MAVYNHTKTIGYVKVAYFLRKIQTSWVKTWESLGLRMWNFQGIILIPTQTYRVIFKFALVYL